MEILNRTVFLLLQISLIALAQNVTSSEENHAKATREINDATESSNVIRKVNETTISSVDRSTVAVNETTQAETSTPLIPVATVEAQIEKLDVTSKKPSRVQIVAAQ
jgi:hypothetical protein